MPSIAFVCTLDAMSSGRVMYLEARELLLSPIFKRVICQLCQNVNQNFV